MEFLAELLVGWLDSWMISSWPCLDLASCYPRSTQLAPRIADGRKMAVTHSKHRFWGIVSESMQERELPCIRPISLLNAATLLSRMAIPQVWNTSLFIRTAGVQKVDPPPWFRFG